MLKNIIIKKEKNRRAIKSNMNTYQNMSKEWEKTENEKKKIIPFDNIHLCVQRKTSMHLINFILLLLS